MSKTIKAIILAVFLVLPLSAYALNGYSGESIALGKDEVYQGNYYAAGNVVEIYGTVNGDLFLAGNDITVDSDNINGDIFAAGNSVTIKGQPKGSVRIAGQFLDISAQVRDNVMAFGQSLKVDKDSVIGGHLTFFGQMLSMSGNVNGELEGAMGTLNLSGRVGGDADIYLSDSSDNNLNLADSAIVEGTLYYQSFKELPINDQATLGGVSFNEITKPAKNKVDNDWFFGAIISFFMLLIVGMIGIYLCPKYFSRAYTSVKEHPIKTFFLGLLLLIVTPLAAVLVAITVIGLPVALIALVFWAVGLYLAKVMAAWLIGKFVKKLVFPKYKWHKLTTLAMGILIMILVGKIPLIGPFIVFLFYLLAWGVFFDIFKFKHQEK